MRILLATSAALLAFGGAATPAFAQYGGSPQEQVDGAPAQPDPSANAPDDDADQQGYVADDPDDMNQEAAPADDEDYGKPGADDAGPVDYADLGADADVDQGDADTDMDQGNVDNDVDQGDVDEDQDQAEPDEPGMSGGGAQADTWQGEDGQTYCRRSDGTTGLIVGGGAGALVGRGIDGGRHRGTGTIIGAIAGAVIGSAVERNANQQGCR
jgi:hypothetical protein